MQYDREKALERNIRFMTEKDSPGIIMRSEGFGAQNIPQIPTLNQYDFPKDGKKYMDAVIERLLRIMEAHRELDDDWLPSLKPTLGMAEHSCFLGGKVRFGIDTSYHIAPLHDMRDWRECRFDKEHPHYKLLLDSMAYLREKSDQYGFYASMRGADGPMDIVNAVRGNDFLYDFYDEPEETKLFTQFCAEAVVWNFENQRPLASQVSGGVISGFGEWLPGHSVGHISEDASCLCSPAQYREFGLPFTKKMLENFDMAELHVHSLGRACIPIFTEMEKLGIIQISDDPNQPSAMDVYKEYAQCLSGRVVKVDLTYEQLTENLDFLRDKKTIVVLNTDSVYKAQKALEMIRNI